MSTPQNLNQMKEMISIDPGEFLMGSIEGDEHAAPRELVRHTVTLTRKFDLGKYPVTQALWMSVMSTNPSDRQGDCKPVESISWFDCINFCNRLSVLEGLERVYAIMGKEVECNFEGNGYRLPTEAEWEYAARGGAYQLYAGSDTCEEVGWSRTNSARSSQDVGQKRPNGFGLYDMSGNVWEWCWDLYEEYDRRSVQDPTGGALDIFSGARRVFRGGSWSYGIEHSRVSRRNWYYPSNRFDDLGLRLCRTKKT